MKNKTFKQRTLSILSEKYKVGLPYDGLSIMAIDECGPFIVFFDTANFLWVGCGTVSLRSDGTLIEEV